MITKSKTKRVAKTVAVGAWLLIATLASVSLASSAELVLWYRQPATDWEREALPVGNGRLGGMVFGGVEKERIQLNDDTLWAGYRRDRHSPEALEALPEVQRLMFAGKNQEATQLANRTMMGRPRHIESYQTLGDLILEFSGIEDAAEYRRQLDLQTAIASTTFEVDGASYSRDVFSSAPDDVLVVRMETDSPQGLSFTIGLSRPLSPRNPERHPFETIVESDDYMVMSGVNNSGQGMSWEAHLKVLPEGGRSMREEDGIKVENADAVTILIASGTSFRFDNHGEVCRATLARAAKKSYEDLLRDHIAEYQSYFNRVELEIVAEDRSQIPTDERIEAYDRERTDVGLEVLYFHFGRYLLISSSRPGTMPANLQGIWNDKMRAPWNSDFHTNINLQMNYWPAQVTNLAECKLPLVDLMESLVEPGSETARRHYGARGWVVHHLTDIWGFTVPADGVHGIWPMGAAWLCRSVWDHYLFGEDRDFLAKRGYPLMKGASKFMLDFLVEAPEGAEGSGYLVTNPSHSPENSFILPNGERALFTYGATMDIMIVRNLFENTLAALDVLDWESEAEFRVEVEQALDRLPPIRISERTGRIQEWIYDYEEAQPGHRHISHLYDLHPGGRITPRETPELAEAMRKTLESRGDWGGSGWAMAVRQNGWARLLDGDRAHQLLQLLLARRTLPNMFDTHPPFQIDGNFGGCAGVAEMLLQSHAGYIELLPALPKAWSTGRLSGLRARGNFVVDIEWDQQSLQRARLLSKGGNPCRLFVGEDAVQIFSGEEEIEQRMYRDGIIEFSTERGRIYDIHPSS